MKGGIVMKEAKKCIMKKIISIFIVGMIMLMSGIVIPEKAEGNELISGFWKYTINAVDEGGVTIVEYTGAERNLKVPSKIAGKKVTCVGGLDNNKFIENVYIPDSVITLGYHAFAGSENLKKVTGMKSVKYISTFAFFGCKKLQSVSISEELKEIGKWAFQDTVISNIDLPEGLEVLGGEAFANCTKLKKVTVPSTVCLNFISNFGEFSGCTSLEEATVKSQGCISDGMFKGCTNLKKITLQNTEEIRLSSFENCSNLTNIKLPSSLRSISEDAFENCSSLSEINLPFGLGYLDMSAFVGCKKLEKLEIPNSVTKLDASGGKTYIRNITIPNSVINIFGYEEDNYRILYTVTYDIWNVKCYPNSLAEKFAKDQKLSYSLLKEKPSSSISISDKNIKIVDGDIRQIKYKITPSDTSDAIVWESSDSDIVKVNGIGEIEGCDVGTATIIATTTSGKRATVNVKVAERPDKVCFDDEEKICLKGTSITQKITAKDYGGRIRNDIIVSYRSTNPTIATVNKNGKVTGKKTGTVAIVAKVAGNQYIYRVKVVNSVSVADRHVSIELGRYSYKYDGKVKKPAVKVTFEGKKLKKGKDYTISYSNNKKVGKAKVTIKGKGKYSGEKTIKFNIYK